MDAPEIIFESKEFVAINKPAGLVVHPAKIAARKRVDVRRTGEPTLVDWLRKRYPGIETVGDDPSVRPGIVHRLDKETSGVMLVAKTQDAFLRLKEMFRGREIKKSYLAIVRGVPAQHEGTIDRPIGIKNGTLKRSVHSAKMAKEAVTRYRVIEPCGEFSLLEVHPETGRTHQIRVHLASIGHPIVGDPLYGKKKGDGAPRLMLHAQSLAFSDGSENYLFEAPTPREFLAFIHSHKDGK